MARIEGPVVSRHPGRGRRELAGMLRRDPDRARNLQAARSRPATSPAFAVKSSPADRVDGVARAVSDAGRRRDTTGPDLDAVLSARQGVPQRDPPHRRARRRRSTVIVPGATTDQRWVRLASRRMYGQLLEAGVRIFEYEPGMTHVKALLVDELWAVIGTTNFDNRSFEHNDEVNVAFRDAARDRAHRRRLRSRSRRSARNHARRVARAAAVGKADRHRRLDSRTTAVDATSSVSGARVS